MIYLDNSATTALGAGAIKKITEAMDCYGNPSSLHSVGFEASNLLGEARRSVAASLGLRAGSGYELIFTGSGTEANNLAISGSVAAKARRESNRIITTDSEHPSVGEPLAQLGREGFEIIKLPTRRGVINLDDYEKVLSGGAFMVTIMMVNNETGAIYDIAGMFALAKRLCPGVITHCDATQGYMKLAFTPKKLGADMLTVSAHKIHGPKGVGALCVSPDILKARKLVPIIRGGGQEWGFRSGTENIIGITGFGGAAAEYYPVLAENSAKITALRNYTENKLLTLGVRINRPEGGRAPHIINLTLPGIKSETMVHYLSSRGFAVSSGSACSSHNEHISQSLTGFGLDAKEAACSIRVSFCDTNTEAEADMFCEALKDGLATLIRSK